MSLKILQISPTPQNTPLFSIVVTPKNTITQSFTPACQTPYYTPTLSIVVTQKKTTTLRLTSAYQTP